MKKIFGATINCGRWSDIKAVKLPKFVLGRAMFKKIYINV